MALDNAKNFAKVTVSTGYNASATSIVLTTGHGAKLPTAPFNAIWWNSTDYADPADDPNVEIVRVTAISTDTLTVTRGQEGITATTKNTASKTYKMIAGMTAKTVNTDIPGIASLTTYVVASSSQILNCFATPFDIIAAPGANKIIVVESLTWRFIWNSVAYANGNNLQIVYSDGTNGSTLITASTVRGTADAYGYWFNTSQATGVAANLSVQLKTTTSAYTAGNSTIGFWIKYRIIDLTSTSY